ncbi:MAG: DoxX family protein [Chlamydiia bacterium]|nr:DoxX family protein [Chlamydiia bacterium]
MFVNPFLRWIARIYNYFIAVGSNLESVFLLYMRLTWGHQFFLSGWHKFHTLDQTGAFFASLGLSHPAFYACLVACCETLGGLCLIFGFASRIAAIPLACIMLTALSVAHSADISNLRFLIEPQSLVKQAPYPFLITATLVFIFGPGRISIDAWLKRWSQGQAKY